MEKNELRIILENHNEWILSHGKSGKRADLRCEDLSGADLRYADLCCADLSGTDLSGADLRCADLWGANLSGADLRDANLSDADLRGAELSEAKISELDAARLSIVPQEGSFIGWKRVENTIVKLRILENARRSNATGRKCRCSAAEVLSITSEDGTKSFNSVTSNRNFTYEVGKIVIPDSFDENRWNECTNGIHFFITREEAVHYV